MNLIKKFLCYGWEAVLTIYTTKVFPFNIHYLGKEAGIDFDTIISLKDLLHISLFDWCFTLYSIFQEETEHCLGETYNHPQIAARSSNTWREEASMRQM